MFKFAIVLLQVARQIIVILERDRLMTQGRRQQIALELAETAKAAAISQKIKAEVGKKNAAEVDRGLADDFRD